MNSNPIHIQMRRTRTVARHLAALMCGLSLITVVAGCSNSIALPDGIRASEAERIQVAHQYAARAAKAEDPIDALEDYQRAIATYRELPHVWNNMGVLLMQGNNFVTAQEAFTTAARLNTQDPRPLYNIGLLYDRRHYMDKARQHYAEALGRDRNYLPALRGVIRADKILNEGNEETLEYIKRALFLETDPRWRQMMELYRIRIENTPMGEFL